LQILIVGFSTRAIAESAVLGGHQIVTLDYFGDRDQRALVENRSLLRDFDLPFSAKSLARVGRGLDADGLVYTSNLENHPGLVADLAQGRRLLGNSPAILRQVRDWRTLRSFCREAGIRFPATRLSGENVDSSVRWLRKPIRGGGGHGVCFWDGEKADSDYFLQAWVDGRAASAAFVADGRRSVVVGVTEQLIGREGLGARGFTWCGNILPLEISAAGSAELLSEVGSMISSLTRRFELRGLNGIDFVVARGADGAPCPVLVEVNPRYTASMELVERAYGLSIFSLHTEAMAGRLPEFSLTECLRTQQVSFGKAIVYARRAVTMPETEGWSHVGRRDVPYPGEQIEAGHPICTVLGRGDSRDACWRDLLARARAVRREIAEETGGTS
jgi:predicted ATP-grasp superfamily ATP-dependent carboligase